MIILKEFVEPSHKVSVLKIFGCSKLVQTIVYYLGRTLVKATWLSFGSDNITSTIKRFAQNIHQFQGLYSLFVKENWYQMINLPIKVCK